MKIALAVHGRFHAFDLARELRRLGHQAVLFTNFPRSESRRWGVPDECTRTFLAHGVAGRIAWRLSQGLGLPYPEAQLYESYGRWLARELAKESWDVIHIWSGFCEESFKAMRGQKALLVCHRSSSHIDTQFRLLEEEKKRVGRPLESPSAWIRSREKREYDLADVVHVPSRFARESFAREGFDVEKVYVIRHGVNTREFRLGPAAADERERRILSQDALRVLSVGTFSFRKGVWDLAQIVKTCRPPQFEYRYIGPILNEAKPLAHSLRGLIELVPKKPQSELAADYAKADLFLLPTIEDGFPFVLAQAQAAGLPVLTTPNGAGLDLVTESETGWVLPARDAGAFCERLNWCDAHRPQLAAMARRTHKDFKPRDWSDVAREFIELCGQAMARKSAYVQ